MPQFDPTWFSSQLFWLFATFMLLYILMSRFLLPPIMEVMERRSTMVASDIEQAQLRKSEAKQAKENYERALTEARTKSQALIDEVLAEQKIKSEAAAKEMEQKIARKLEEAERAIDSRQDTLLESLIPATADMAKMIVGKVAGAKA